MSEEFDIYNDTLVAIPAGGLCLPAGGFNDDGAYKVIAPTADSQTGLVVVGEFSLLPGATGRGSFANRAVVAVDRSTGIPEDGDTVGSLSGSFYAKTGNTGFVCVGGTAGVWCSVRRMDFGTGNVFGPEPAASTTGHIAIWSDTTGRFLSDSLVSASGGNIDAPGDGDFGQDVSAGRYVTATSAVFSQAFSFFGASAPKMIEAVSPVFALDPCVTFRTPSVGVTHEHDVDILCGYVCSFGYHVYTAFGVLTAGGSATTGGATFLNGLYISGTIGGGVSLSGTNTWTATNTYEPSSNVVPVVAKSSAGGTADLFQAKSSGGTTVAKIDVSGNLMAQGGTFGAAVGVTGTVTATTFSGSGASLTALPAGQLTGTVDGGSW